MSGDFLQVQAPAFRNFQDRLARAEAALTAERERETDRLGRTHQDRLRAEAPRGETGKYARAIQYRTFARDGEIGYTVEMLQPLTDWIREGTPPRTIRPKNGKALAFRGRGGKMIFAREVKHPGTPADPFVERVADDMESEIGMTMRRLGASYTMEMGG